MVTPKIWPNSVLWICKICYIRGALKVVRNKWAITISSENFCKTCNTLCKNRYMKHYVEWGDEMCCYGIGPTLLYEQYDRIWNTKADDAFICNFMCWTSWIFSARWDKFSECLYLIACLKGKTYIYIYMFAVEDVLSGNLQIERGTFLVLIGRWNPWIFWLLVPCTRHTYIWDHWCIHDAFEWLWRRVKGSTKLQTQSNRRLAGLIWEREIQHNNYYDMSYHLEMDKFGIYVCLSQPSCRVQTNQRCSTAVGYCLI
jgi:hypothetical protein